MSMQRAECVQSKVYLQSRGCKLRPCLRNNCSRCKWKARSVGSVFRKALFVISHKLWSMFHVTKTIWNEMESMHVLCMYADYKTKIYVSLSQNRNRMQFSLYIDCKLCAKQLYFTYHSNKFVGLTMLWNRLSCAYFSVNLVLIYVNWI